MITKRGLALQPIATMPLDIVGQCLVYGQVWASIDDVGKEDLSLWEAPKYYVTEKVRGGIITVNPSFVTGELTECRATFWCQLAAPTT